MNRRRLLAALAALAGAAGFGAAGSCDAVGAGSLSAPARRAAGYLERAQNADGGLGSAPGQSSAALFAGWAALGLSSAGVDVATLRARGGEPSLLDYVRSGAGASDTGSLERTILVLRAAGAPAGALVPQLLARVSGRGSVGGQVNLSAFALLALRAAGGSASGTAQARLATWLAGQADSNGGYGYAGRGSGSDADDTGAVLEALGSIAGSRVAVARRNAVAYLHHDQDADGGYPAAPGAGSNAQSTAWAVQGLIAAGVSPASVVRHGHTPLAYLDSLVSAGGAVSYARGQTQTPVWVTGEALMALTGTPLPLVGRRAGGPSSSATVRASHSATTGPGGSTLHPSSPRGVRRSRRHGPERDRHHARTRGAGHPVAAVAADRAVARAVARMQATLGGLPARVIAGAGLGD